MRRKPLGRVVFFPLEILNSADAFGSASSYTDAMQAHVEMLVVSSSRTIREGLQSLALALPHVNRVHAAHSDLRSLPEQDKATPAIILLDCTSPVLKCPELLSQVRTQWPHIKSVVLVDTEKERIQLDSTDIDVVLLKGIPAVRLLAILKRLLHAASCS